jgi:hypothetical protein
MVPNHMGIDSRWVIEHPDWFLSLDHSPYPTYSFDGPDLADDSRVGVFIEDHYWDRSDAAVVFKRLDRETGDERYIYHGNDGTSMPWNDTAQLDYLKPEVREAVIQTILAVARRSPVIRFDAAMTLARQHFHRLWFPEPGAAGAVPSRAEHSMTRADFDNAMPREFWREVVDRVAEEAPDTLLLAEAFWLLEGYFVRTLGMHRVYNSAFMNMLRDERNAEYRQLMKSTLEFDPQILKRYVNFMSNPDERTAIDQFGTGDKYFGVATLMATMPGLPMIGHGQIEGLAEKYGMEFRRPRWDESANEGLVRRHELQIFPLLSRRRIFAEVGRFLLYDFVTDDGSVDENVFAFSNDIDGERSLVVYHNRFGETCGRLRLSTSVAETVDGEDTKLVRTSLGDGLRLPEGDDCWVIYRDVVTDSEFLRPCRELRADGWYLELDAYRLHCLIDFRDVIEDEEHPWSELAERLEGRGVRSLDDALGQWKMAALLGPLLRLLVADSFDDLAAGNGAEFLNLAGTEVAEIVAAVENRMGAVPRARSAATEGRILTELETLVSLVEFARAEETDDARDNLWLNELRQAFSDPVTWASAITWIVTRNLDEWKAQLDSADLPGDVFAEWHLRSTLIDHVIASGRSDDEGRRAVDMVGLLLETVRRDGGDGGCEDDLAAVVSKLAAGEAGRRHLRVNSWDDELWFNREALEEMVGWLQLGRTLDRVVADSEAATVLIMEADSERAALLDLAEDSGYRLRAFVERLGASEGAVVAED